MLEKAEKFSFFNAIFKLSMPFLGIGFNPLGYKFSALVPRIALKGQCHEIFDLRFFFIKQDPLGP
jgi:hypothetical protein